MPARLHLLGKFQNLEGGAKSFCRRAITKANTDLVRRVAAAPSVSADASDGAGIAALVQAVRREDAKVTIEVGGKLKVGHLICVLLVGLS